MGRRLSFPIPNVRHNVCWRQRRLRSALEPWGEGRPDHTVKSQPLRPLRDLGCPDAIRGTFMTPVADVLVAAFRGDALPVGERRFRRCEPPRGATGSRGVLQRVPRSPPRSGSDEPRAAWSESAGSRSPRTLRKFIGLRLRSSRRGYAFEEHRPTPATLAPLDVVPSIPGLTVCAHPVPATLTRIVRPVLLPSLRHLTHLQRRPGQAASATMTPRGAPSQPMSPVSSVGGA